MASAAWRVVWITGASTGIGRAVAIKLAARGILVAASARSAAMLAELASAHPNIRAYPLDVGDRAAQAAVISSIERDLGPIDLAILSAGVWHPGSSDELDVAKVEQALLINYTSAIYTLDALLPLMRTRARGHVAFVASVAGYIGLPRAIAYAPTKAALISLAECLKTDAARFGIDISVINPGFVETPMTAENTFPMPFLVKVDDAADIIIKGLERKKFEIAFPWQLVTLLKLARRAPYPLFFWIINRGGVQPKRETKA
jgi:short-subunit dehydrogenase